MNVTPINQQSPVLIAQDLSAVSTISMSVAAPILAAFGRSLAILPTSLLSTQTEEFGVPAKANLAQWLPAVFKHWETQHINMAGTLTGYLGSELVIDSLTEFISQQPDQLIVIDPVMADQGTLYPGLSTEYPIHMRKLIRLASVIVPNLTEAQLLTKIVTPANCSIEHYQPILNTLQNLSAKDSHAIVTGITHKHQLGCVWLDDHQHVQFAGRPILSGHFYGSGDVFAALLTGFLTNQEPLASAIDYATRGTFSALQDTDNANTPCKMGIQLAQLMGRIVHYTETGHLTLD